MTSALPFALLLLAQSDVKTTDLKGGFVRITTAKYEIEIPKGWEVGRETSFGQREIVSEKGEMSTMTGSAGNRGWEGLYNTSLFFVKRSMPGSEPTPFTIVKTKQGYEAMSFSMVKESKATARYIILKNKANDILALSIKIKDRKSEKELESAFDRLVNTAKML